VLGAYDLPSNLPPGTNHDEVISLFARDKKALDGITFVLDGPAGVEVVTGVSEGRMREALERISSTTAPKDATS
jgi:5-deoxy-5-amino-3-dehydroquinate synthase